MDSICPGYKQCCEFISGRLGIIYRIRIRIMEFNHFYMNS
jgi:hypothetical protein